MAEYKLSSLKELFPEKNEKTEAKVKKENYGHMFQISEEEKVKVVEFICQYVEECKKQREGWLETREECIKNYEGICSGRGPWEGSSNISTMATTIAVDMIHSRLFPMVWNPDLIYWKGTTSHSEEIAKNNRTFSQWIFTKDMEDTQDKVDEIVGRLVADGLIAVKRTWEKKFVHVTRVEPKGTDDKGNMQYEIVYDKVKRERARWIIKDIEHVYFPYNCTSEDDADPGIVDEIFYTLPMLRELQQHGLILSTIDMDVVKKAVEKRYDPDGGKKVRLESAGVETYTAMIESMPIKCYEGWVKYDINEDKVREECVFLVLPEIKMYLAGKPLHCVSRIGKRAWKIRSFLPRWGTIYGKGIPELVRHLHNELDAIHNQRIDAGNMVIAPFFFYRAASGFDPKTISVKPATGIPLDDPQRDVQFPDYNPSRLSVSFQEENIIMDLISKLTYLPPTAFGRETADRPTARGTMALIAESSQPFNLLAGRVLKIILSLITDTRKMYEEHWDNNYARSILDEKGNQHWSVLSPEMIAGDYLAFSEVDLEASNTAFEKQADQVMYQTLSPNPLVQQNPSFFWELTANFITSMGKKDVTKYIGPKPDYEGNPGIVDDENQFILREQQVNISPKDDDVAHMNGHSKFKREMAAIMTPEAMTMLVMHIEEHRLSYLQKMQQLTLQQQGGAGASQGQTGNSGPLSTPSVVNIQGPNITGSTGGQPNSAPVPQGQAPGGPLGSSASG